MLEAQANLDGHVAAGARLADDVAADYDMAGQFSLGAVDRSARLRVKLAELADVVQDRAGHHQILVERRLQFGIVIGVFIGKKDGRARHA